jgi:hypothetical protein
MKNSMPALLMLVIVVLISIAFGLIVNKVEDVTSEYDSILNKEIILKSDTLLIIDCSIWDETVTLENGNKINYKLAKELINE